MQAGARGNLGERMALSAHLEHRTVLGMAACQQPNPQIVGLNRLARARLRRDQLAWALVLAEGLFTRRVLILARPVDQSVARGDIEKTPQLIGVSEAPASFAKAAQQVDPN
jgi:hypothetical protein